MKRSVLEKKIAILQNAMMHPKSVTKLMRSCNMSYNVIKKYLDELLSLELLAITHKAVNGMIRTEKKLYSTTIDSKAAVILYSKILAAFNKKKTENETR